MKQCLAFPSPWLFLWLLSLGAACDSDSAPSQPSPAPTVQEAPASRPLRVTLNEDVPTLDPHHHLTIVGNAVLRNLFEPLVDLDSKGELIPRLAERWETSDSQHWQFWIRPGVAFHDGTVLTAQDVVFSLERARNDPRSEVAGFLSKVDSISQDASAGRVDLVTHRPDPFFLESLASILIVSHEAPAEIVQPVGTGPYRFVSYQRGALFQLEGFPGYWRGGPAEKSAEFLIIPGADEAVRLLEKNQVDIVCNLPSQLVDRVEANLKLWVESRLSESVVYLQLNHRVPPFDDPRIRQAIDLALDREELVREVSLNYARPASQMLGPDIFGHDPDLTPPKRDLVAARRLIKEAGYAAGPNLSIEITEAYELYAAVLARQLDEAGFQTSVKIRPWPELYADLRAGTVGIWFGLWAFDSSEAGLFFEALAHTPTSDGSFGAGNFSRYSDPDLDRAIQEAVAELDLPKRKEKLQEISRRFTQIRGLLPILWPLDLYGMRRDLDWEAREDGRILFFDMKRRASEDE